ncbi:MAG: hypothetical protein JNL80_09020 [Phycisphaerae bacterium]|nr:hypothetical protein [Phycisphaerae bacterium]
MKNVLVAAALAAGVAGVAAADVKLDFGSGDYAAGDSAIIKLTNLEGTLTGFSFSFDYVGDGFGFSWASDAGFVLNGVQYGGYDILFGGPGLSSATSSAGAWSFYGGGSSGDGTYGDAGIGAAGSYVYGDSYIFEWGNNYSGSGPVSYNNVTVTLHGVSQVPAPGAIALLGLAGLVGRRRRA